MSELQSAEDIAYYLDKLNNYLLEHQNSLRKYTAQHEMRIRTLEGNLGIAIDLIKKMSLCLKSDALRLASWLEDWATSDDDDQQGRVNELKMMSNELEHVDVNEIEDVNIEEEEEMHVDERPSTSKIKLFRTAETVKQPQPATPKKNLEYSRNTLNTSTKKGRTPKVQTPKQVEKSPKQVSKVVKSPNINLKKSAKATGKVVRTPNPSTCKSPTATPRATEKQVTPDPASRTSQSSIR